MRRTEGELVSGSQFFVVTARLLVEVFDPVEAVAASSELVSTVDAQGKVVVNLPAVEDAVLVATAERISQIVAPCQGQQIVAHTETSTAWPDLADPEAGWM